MPVNTERFARGGEHLKVKGKDFVQDPRFDRPLSKETARLKYGHPVVEDEAQRPVRFENLVEAKIKKAMADGEFDNLPGKGRPIDLHAYDSMPAHLRVGYQMLKNWGYLPEEVRLIKEMAAIREQLSHCASEAEKQKLMKALAEATQQFHFHMEYNKKFSRSLF